MHVSRECRSKYELAEALFSLRGTLVIAEPSDAQLVAHRINEARDAARFPESAVRGGELYAAGLLDEIYQLVVQLYREQFEPELYTRALDYLREHVSGDAADDVLLRFVTDFPTVQVLRGEQQPDEHLEDVSGAAPQRHVTLEELLMLRLANENPGVVRFRELFHDGQLVDETAYEDVIRALEGFFNQLPGMDLAGAGLPGIDLPAAGKRGLVGKSGTSLLEMLRAPALANPTSLEGQLEFIRQHWAGLLGDRFSAVSERILRTRDVLAEEHKQAWVGPGPVPVLDADSLRMGDVEYERYSADSSWMPRVVLIAKSTYVWLDQLSRLHGRDIHHLDQVPDEELDRLAAAGFTSLWLIGLWERSQASRRIKHLRGDPDAVASAYALDDYVIAADLGGDQAYENLRERAWQRRIRLAADMVPNHVGIDGRWIVEHPHWFLSLDHPPYPGYAFTGEDLSTDPDITVQIEDHYWDGSDAAVVFKRYDHRSDETRFIYHGNDGTVMPWNDTAQLNYLDAEVREGVIQTILHVARRFPIIRFDAAMTLAKKHIQRLWFPQPGHGGAIPSRAQYGMTTAQFDAHIPEEFWREVVDRVTAEVPDTLLLAEAFWLMESYFVRTLGMHRVYNSAFMHMMAGERNAEHRQLMKNVLEFDPEVLKRFVNFMSNPDEETAVAQFGKDDKYFGVATVLATMPGLPMFGHGQLEGFTEKYGMDFRQAKWQEDPDQWLVDRHRREIFPLLHRRHQFSQVSEFLLYDLVAPVGHVNENVYAYSNRVDGAASLVIFNNTFARAVGHIHHSLPYQDKGSSELRSRPLADGLALRATAGDCVLFRDHVSNLEYVRRSRELADHGLAVDLDAYECRVYLDFREVADDGGHYATLADRLGGMGIASVENALANLALEPLHRALIATIEAASDPDGDLQPAYERWVAETAHRGGGPAESTADAHAAIVDNATDLTSLPAELADSLPTKEWRRTLAATVGAIQSLPGDVDDPFENWRLHDALRDALRGALQGALSDPVRGAFRDALGFADLVPILLRHGDWDVRSPQGRKQRSPVPAAADALAALLADDQVLAYLGVNEHDGALWFDSDAYRRLTAGLVTIALGRSREPASRVRIATMAAALAQAEQASDYQLTKLAVDLDHPTAP